MHEGLDKKLTQAYQTIVETICEKKVHPRMAATVVAVARIAVACEFRGWV